MIEEAITLARLGEGLAITLAPERGRHVGEILAEEAVVSQGVASMLGGASPAASSTIR